MGGIAGIIDYNRDMTLSAHIVNEMLQKTGHRGGSELRIRATQSAAMGGVSRYSGGQPLTRNLGQHIYTAVFDGQLMNAAELRQELSQKGHAFFSHSDIETLLAAYIEWGPSCPDHLNGAFAFAVWEEHTQRLFMARDRFGVKPFFYALTKSMLVFGSEIKALLCHPEISPVVGEEGLLELFALGPGRTPGKTPYREIGELKPGECMVYSRLGIYIHRYWQFACAPHTETADETAEHIRFLLQDAVKKQLSSEPSICTFLSGGLDSSSVSSLASREILNKNGYLNSYSVHFPQNEKYFHENLYQPDEDTGYIRIMTEHLKCDHTVFTAGIGDMAAALKDAMVARDLPGMADIDSSLLLLSREMGKNFSVALSGECADELFGGYPWFYNNDLLYSASFPWAQSAALRRSLLGGALAKLPLEEYARDRYQDIAAETPALKDESREAQLRRRMSYATIKGFMANLLERQDRMGMSAGLEIRSPFVDHRLAEYAWNIPWDMKNYGGMEKGILRLAMKNIVPQTILMRKKSPYPKTHHPDYLQNVSNRLKEILADDRAALWQLISRDAAQALIADPEKVTTPWYGQLMTAPQLIAYLLQLQMWLEEYRVRIEI